MKLTNTIVTFTVTIPEMTVNSDDGIPTARFRIRDEARHLIKLGDDDMTIVDCPSYPALCN